MASCPASFQPHPVLATACVAQCTPEFEIRIVNGVPRCVYKTNPDVSYQLNPLVAPVGATEAATELARANAESAIQVERVGSDQRIRDAFTRLQEAENARDEAPDAYQVARNQYYTLTNGDTWLAEERERIARAEVNPMVDRYSSMYRDVSTRVAQQQQTFDVVRAVKDNVLSIKDEIEYSVGTMDAQLKDIKNQINIKRQERRDAPPDILSWIDILMNALLVIVFVALIIIIYRKVSGASTLGSTTYGG